jgi:Uma2 family endonuclease
MVTPINLLTIEAFLALPEGERPLELIDGQAIAKVSPKFFHSRLQKKLLFLLDEWATDNGRVYPEWAIKLNKKGNDWIPVPDLVYVSFNRLSADWMLDEACPVAPELAIEIVSPGQTFGDLAEKATDYLQAGLAKVWIVDSKAQTITVFSSDRLPQTFRGNTILRDEIFPKLEFIVQDIF